MPPHYLELIVKEQGTLLLLQAQICYVTVVVAVVIVDAAAALDNRQAG